VKSLKIACFAIGSVIGYPSFAFAGLSAVGLQVDTKAIDNAQKTIAFSNKRTTVRVADTEKKSAGDAVKLRQDKAKAKADAKADAKAKKAAGHAEHRTAGGGTCPKPCDGGDIP